MSSPEIWQGWGLPSGQAQPLRPWKSFTASLQRDVPVCAWHG